MQYKVSCCVVINFDFKAWVSVLTVICFTFMFTDQKILLLLNEYEKNNTSLVEFQ